MIIGIVGSALTGRLGTGKTATAVALMLKAESLG